MPSGGLGNAVTAVSLTGHCVLGNNTAGAGGGLSVGMVAASDSVGGGVVVALTDVAVVGNFVSRRTLFT